MIPGNRLWQLASQSAMILLRMTKNSNKMGRIFVEDTLVEPLEGRTIDVREGDDGPELIFR